MLQAQGDKNQLKKTLSRILWLIESRPMNLKVLPCHNIGYTYCKFFGELKVSATTVKTKSGTVSQDKLPIALVTEMGVLIRKFTSRNVKVAGGQVRPLMFLPL